MNNTFAQALEEMQRNNTQAMKDIKNNIETLTTEYCNLEEREAHIKALHNEYTGSGETVTVRVIPERKRRRSTYNPRCTKKECNKSIELVFDILSDNNGPMEFRDIWSIFVAKGGLLRTRNPRQSLLSRMKQSSLGTAMLETTDDGLWCIK